MNVASNAGADELQIRLGTLLISECLPRHGTPHIYRVMEATSRKSRSLGRAKVFARSAIVLLGIIATGAKVHAQSQMNLRTMVVYSDADSPSKKVAEYYLAKRNIPPQNVCRIKTWSLTNDGLSSISWRDYPSMIERPIRKCLLKIGPDKILYIVFSYDTPYKLTDVPKGAGVAVDQYVADVWEDMQPSPTDNPYYARIQSKLSVYPPFQSLADYRAAPGGIRVYSVWRLDAATAALARGLVDKAIAAEQTGAAGQACIDRRFGNDIEKLPDTMYDAGDWDLFRAGEFLRQAGIPVTEDTDGAEFGTPPAPARCDNAIFYAGWYSLNHYNDAFSWNTGAIGIHLDSGSAADPRGGTNWSANALKRGITVTSGALNEPFLPGLPHPDGIVHDLLAGSNVGDAFLRNTAELKWMIINIGDPLYRPKFRAGSTTRVQQR